MSRQKLRKSVGKLIRYHKVSKISKAVRKAMKSFYKPNRNGRQYSRRFLQDMIDNYEFLSLSGDVSHPKSDD